MGIVIIIYKDIFEVEMLIITNDARLTCCESDPKLGHLSPFSLSRTADIYHIHVTPG